MDPADPRRWGWRRAAAFAIIFACLAIIWRAVELGGGDAVRVTAVTALAGLLAAVALAYIFAPSLDAGWEVLKVFAGRDRDGGSRS